MQYYKILTSPESLAKYQRYNIYFYTDGKYIKFKDKYHSLTSSQLSKEYVDNLYITMSDRIFSVKHKQSELNKELTQAITVNVGKARKALKNIVDNLLDEPRTIVLTEAKKSITIIVNEFLNDPHIVTKLTEVALHDYSTSLHLTNCMLLCIGYAYFHKLGTAEMKKMGLMGLMHDIGKVDIPDYILQSPRKLTDEEFDIIKQHPTRTRQLLSEAGGFHKDIIEAAYEHHERLDGSGYPKGKKEKDINHYAKILAVVDVYEALTHWRPYKDALKPIDALKIMKKDIDDGKLSKKELVLFAQSIATK